MAPEEDGDFLEGAAVDYEVDDEWEDGDGRRERRLRRLAVVDEGDDQRGEDDEEEQRRRYWWHWQLMLFWSFYVSSDWNGIRSCGFCIRSSVCVEERTGLDLQMEVDGESGGFAGLRWLGRRRWLMKERIREEKTTRKRSADDSRWHW